VRAAMPDPNVAFDRRDIEELSRVIEADADFVDSFLAVSSEHVDDAIYEMLLGAVEAALQRRPDSAELHHRHGRVLERLSRIDDAIDANERAVGLDPRQTRALISAAKLYRIADRQEEAVSRLESAITQGAEYPDVFTLLGDAYRDQGDFVHARQAYHRALTINERYPPAHQGLESLKELPSV